MKEHRVFIRDDQHLWLLEKAIPVFDILDWFPPDSIGDPKDQTVRKLTFKTDCSADFQSIIEKGKFCIAERSQTRAGTMQFLQKAGAGPGKTLVIRKLTDFEYFLGIE